MAFLKDDEIGPLKRRAFIKEVSDKIIEPWLRRRRETPTLRRCLKRNIDAILESRPPRKNYNQLSSNEKLDNRQKDDIQIEEAEAESDASSTDLEERENGGVCPPCAHDRYNNNVRRHAHDDFSDDTDYDEALTCNVCDRSFPTRRQLGDHQQKKRHFGCSACDSLFPSLMALEHHKEEFQHWSDSSYCSHSDSEDSDLDTCHEDKHRLL